MSLHRRVSKLERRVAAAPDPYDGRRAAELSDEELELVIAHGTELTVDEVRALSDDALARIPAGNAPA
jgi:hypothetical protein